MSFLPALLTPQPLRRASGANKMQIWLPPGIARFSDGHSVHALAVDQLMLGGLLAYSRGPD